MPKDILWQQDQNSKPIYVGSIREAKKLLKQKGGKAWIEYCDRDGTLIEVQSIQMRGKNDTSLGWRGWY